jgi:hypothetical protein
MILGEAPLAALAAIIIYIYIIYIFYIIKSNLFIVVVAVVMVSVPPHFEIP